MNRSIEQALLSLLPTHNSSLPQPLTELASSLLAQSRHRASTLKAEEEVARPFACAHLACDRLKITLNLPPIEPRPPIPPRIYKRLYNHLDKILPAPASTPNRATPGAPGLGSGPTRTPSTKLREQQQLLGTSPLANKTRPGPQSKEKSLSQLRGTNLFSTTTSDSPSKKRGAPHDTTDPVRLPRWMRPTLRFLCSHLGPARIGPVVASGVESIVAPAGKLTDDKWVLANLAAVLGALYLHVWRGVTGQGLDRERYMGFRTEVAACLTRARTEVEVLGGGVGLVRGEDEEDWKGWREVKVGDLDTAALRINRHGWFEMEWVGGIEDLVQMETRKEEEREEEEDGDVEPVQIRRPDTMFQERWDYLSERKRKAYAEWKEGMLKRIKQLEPR